MILAIVQARMGSTRLPGKVLKSISGCSLIDILLSRLSKSKRIEKIVVATTDQKSDDHLSKACFELGYDVFRGSEDDVLSRYYHAACQFRGSTIIRITGDCPLIDGSLVDRVLELFEKRQVDYASNIEPASFPDGLDVEVFTFEALSKAFKFSGQKHEREHVTPYLRESVHVTRANLKNNVDHSLLRWTVDDPQDLEVVRNVFDYFSPRLEFSWTEVMDLQRTKPALFKAYLKGVRNMGAEMGNGQKLWSRAKKVIPGGNMLLSKRPEMFLPEKWPTYFDKCKGCTIWDIDGQVYTDMSIMGVGTNILGYGHPKIDEAVKNSVSKGNMSTINCPEDVLLAERLVDMHPWADMVKFARSGGEANAIAVRIARAATGKENIAISGYHGWHDW